MRHLKKRSLGDGVSAMVNEYQLKRKKEQLYEKEVS
jgi:hypothetical protein